MVDRTALEMRHRCKHIIGGSNPSLSATLPLLSSPETSVTGSYLRLGDSLVPNGLSRGFKVVYSKVDPVQGYSGSLAGMRGASSGVKTSPSPWAKPGLSAPPVVGSPPSSVRIEVGVVSVALACPAPPSPAPMSAVRPPCGWPSALALTAASVFSASLAL